MNQKSYADSQTILTFGRIFADQMQKCLENAGLAKEGWCFGIRVTNAPDEEFKTVLRVDLERDITKIGGEEWAKTHYCQIRFNEKGWLISYDPVCDTGAVPPVVCYREKKGREPQTATTGRKETPPDGLWLSAYDDPPYMGGGW